MKRNLFAISLLTISISAIAQTTSTPKILTHVDKDALVYLSNGALYYNGGGFQTKDTGVFENHGNVMLVASDTTNDVYRTLKADGTNKGFSDAGGVFINVLNNPTQPSYYNSNDDGSGFSYGQLYISGISQGNIVGYVNQQYRNVSHGAYQQIALPFKGKAISSLSTELGKTFTDVRWSQNEILKFNNPLVVFDPANQNTVTTNKSDYFILGNKNNSLDVTNTTRTLVGIPYSDGSATVTLQNAGNGVNFGVGGSAINMYNEWYKSYWYDGFYMKQGGTAWDASNGFGKNIYQFGNPYLTNLDLRSLFVSSDINYVSNLYGIRVEPASGVVSYSPNVGGNGNTTPRYITWSGGNLVGDVEWAMLRPMSVFAMKLNDNSAGKSINFDNLRRFKYTPRTSGAYDVTAKANNTVKQLGVIALDATGFEIGRTYYVVSPTAVNGNAPGITMQTQAETTNVIGTFEEDPINGGYDMNLISNYWLYINEANEITFKGKAIPGALYSQNIKSLKFEIRENEALIPNGNTTLSTGIGFYYKLENGTVQSIAQNQTVPVTVGSQGLEVNLYYGAPTAALATDDVKTKPSRTMVVYNPTIDNFVVLFDPNWKKADVKVYDMSGKLVLSANKVDTNKDFVIDLMKGNKGFVVSVTSETGTVVNAKIIR